MEYVPLQNKMGRQLSYINDHYNNTLAIKPNGSKADLKIPWCSLLNGKTSNQWINASEISVQMRKLWTKFPKHINPQ